MLDLISFFSKFIVQCNLFVLTPLSLLHSHVAPSPGTSDGRFLAAAGCSQVIELGPTHKTIHKVDEHVAIEDLQVLVDIYENLLERLLLKSVDDEA